MTRAIASPAARPFRIKLEHGEEWLVSPPMTRAPCLRRLKLVSGGAWLAARIHRPCHCTPNGGDEAAPHPWRDTCDRYPRLAAEIDGNLADVDVVWTSGEEIDEAEYRYLMDDRAHARAHRPDSPEANPRQPIDFDTLQPPTFD